jgi:DNA-binding helix-hairpin-helix protein with protein kinase domain
MSVLTCRSTGEPIILAQQIATSGEGAVWRTNRNGYLAKVYHTPRPDRDRKLEVMVAHPPYDPNLQANHISFAWPKSLLQNVGGQCVGFLMPEITNSVDLLNVYSPVRRWRVLPGFNWLYLHTTAMNIASIVWAIHEAGYVLGDIKSQNILVNNRALPSIIDTDSFQVRDPKTGEVYVCTVGSEGFTPPELLEVDLSQVEQREVHDRFRLGVVIHLLLFGDHPFKGCWTGVNESPTPNELIQKGFWPYASGSLIQAGPLTIPLQVVHPAVRNCFLRCFNEGHSTPTARPTASEWLQALKLATTDLKVCRKTKRHYFSPAYGNCYWCDRQKRLGVDIFSTGPTPESQVQKQLKGLSTSLKKYRQFQPPQRQPLPKSQGLQRRSSLSTVVMTALLPLKTLSTGVIGNIRQSVLQLSTLWPIAIVMTLIAGTFAGLMLLSRTEMSPEDITLTVSGILLCLSLVPLCFLWLRVMHRYNSQ